MSETGNRCVSDMAIRYVSVKFFTTWVIERMGTTSAALLVVITRKSAPTLTLDVSSDDLARSDATSDLLQYFFEVLETPPERAALQFRNKTTAGFWGLPRDARSAMKGSWEPGYPPVADLRRFPREDEPEG